MRDSSVSLLTVCMSKKIHDAEEMVRLRATIGARLRLARKAMGMTQKQVAKLMAISSESYLRVERSQALPTVPTIRRMARVLNVTVDHLLGHDDENEMSDHPVKNFSHRVS